MQKTIVVYYPIMWSRMQSKFELLYCGIKILCYVKTSFTDLFTCNSSLSFSCVFSGWSDAKMWPGCSMQNVRMSSAADAGDGLAVLPPFLPASICMAIAIARGLLFYKLLRLLDGFIHTGPFLTVTVAAVGRTRHMEDFCRAPTHLYLCRCNVSFFQTKIVQNK